MMNHKVSSASEAYQAPESLVLALESQEICQTSLSGGEIQPGQGSDWGSF